MSDSFFGFDISSTNCDDESDEVGEDEDYDALNDETFGESNLSTDWEENHEKLAAELTGQSRRSFDDENGELSERIASYILDDENEDLQVKNQSFFKSGPPPNFTTPAQWLSNMQNTKNVTFLPSPTNSFGLQTGPMMKMCTVEELERNLRSKASQSSSATPPPGVRLEDIERELTGSKIKYTLSTSTPGKIAPVPGPLGFPNSRLELPPIVHSHFNQMHVPRDMLFKPSGPGFVRLPVPNLPPMPILNPQDELSFFRHQHQRPYSNSFHTVQDEYAGLMSPQEKQWLASIQLMQLNTNQPFQDDYYFQMYQSRQQGKCGHKMGGHGVKNNRCESVTSKPAYTPLQFENSLGKLQVGSVTAPRKIIDMDVVENVECASQNSSRKCKQLLLEIERMYSQVLIVEEFHSPLMGPRLDVNPKEIMQKINNALLLNNKLVSIMAIKKGKTLVLRILPHLDNPGPVIHRLISNMMVISRKDTEQTLLRLLPVIRIWLASTSLQTLVQLSSTFENSLSAVLTNKFAVSVLANMVERAETTIPFANDNEVKDWLQVISRLIESAQQVTSIERPVVGVDGNMLSRHFTRVTPTSGDKQDLSILRRALSNLQISDIKIKM